MKDLKYSRFVPLLFILTILFTIGTMVFTYRNLLILKANNDMVVHTNNVKLALKDMFVNILNAETGQRGYLASGDKTFLEPYNSAMNQLETNLSSVKTLTKDSATQQKNADQLRSLVNNRVELLKQGIVIRDTQGISATQSFLIQGQGKVVMDQIRNLVADMDAQESELLEIRQEQTNSSFKTIYITTALAAAFNVALILLTFLLQRRLENTLQDTKTKLEKAVKDRTKELQNTNNELARSNRELQDFASVASHDLQEPLRKIQAFGDRLKTKAGATLSDDGKDYLERMLNAAGRMRILIEDLLTFSRVTTKALPYELIDLNTVMAGVLSDLEVRIEQKKAVVEVSPLPTIEADPLQMRQIFQNLISNGLKFHSPDINPKISITNRIIHKTSESKTKKDIVEILVKDNGIGFEEKYLDRIFTIFQRLHGRSEYEGTGIGLAVVRKIVERHGGTITAVSSPNKGATFIVKLPVIQTQPKDGEKI